MIKQPELQLGHSQNQRLDFKIEYMAERNWQEEVPFSHRHSFYALVWIQEGNGKHLIDFEEYEIRPNRIFFIRPAQIHFISCVSNLRYSTLQFTEEFIMPFEATTQKHLAVCNDITKEEEKRIDILFQQIYEESHSSLPNSTAIIQSEINTLLLEVERMSLSASNVSIVPEMLDKFKKMIESNYATERQVQDYASRLGVTPNYLNVLTRKHLGRSALSMINDRVMLEVKRSLLRTDLDISEIAYKYGFNELSYFSRFFKRNAGMTPNQFRQTMNEMYQK